MIDFTPPLHLKGPSTSFTHPYKLFDPSNQSVIIIRDVQFHYVSPPPKSIESHITLNFSISPITPISITPSSFVPIIDHSSFSSSSITHESNGSPKVNFVASHVLVWVKKTIESIGIEVSNPSYTCRTRSNFALMTKVMAIDDPTSYAQAKGKPHWEQAMSNEYESLLRNKTWSLISLPLGNNLVYCK